MANTNPWAVGGPLAALHGLADIPQPADALDPAVALPALNRVLRVQRQLALAAIETQRQLMLAGVQMATAWSPVGAPVAGATPATAGAWQRLIDRYFDGAASWVEMLTVGAAMPRAVAALPAAATEGRDDAPRAAPLDRAAEPTDAGRRLRLSGAAQRIRRELGLVTATEGIASTHDTPAA